LKGLVMIWNTIYFLQYSITSIHVAKAALPHSSIRSVTMATCNKEMQCFWVSLVSMWRKYKETHNKNIIIGSITSRHAFFSPLQWNWIINGRQAWKQNGLIDIKVLLFINWCTGELSLKNSKIYIKFYIKTTPTCFGVTVTPSPGSALISAYWSYSC